MSEGGEAAMADWRVHTDGSRPVHVWPVSDLVGHDTDDDEGDCACGPLITPVPRDDGSYGWLITHHALDGRP